MTGASDWRIMKSHLLPHLVAPLIVYSTLIVADQRDRRGRALVPRARHPRADRELGEPARRGPELLPDPAVADGLAGTRDPADDARVQPARRRPPRRVRPASRRAEGTSYSHYTWHELFDRADRPTVRWLRSQRGAESATYDGRSPMHKKAHALRSRWRRSGLACSSRPASLARRARVHVRSQARARRSAAARSASTSRTPTSSSPTRR